MGDDDLVKNAERELIAAAEEWDSQQVRSQRLLSSQSQRLRAAVYMLKRARSVTGKVRLEDIHREIARDEATRKRDK